MSKFALESVSIANSSGAVLRAGRSTSVLFCWAEVSGYMAACWHALASRPDIQLHVVHPEQLWGKTNPFLAESALLNGISNEMFHSDRPDVDKWLRKIVADRQPDVLVLCGWVFRPYTRLAKSSALKNTRVVVGMDSPWRGTMSQRLAKFRLAGLVRRLDLVVTTGERSREYAHRIGVPDRKIRSGYYGFDHALFNQVAAKRAGTEGSWPRRFLFTGRYVPQKNLAVLMKAYTAYRSRVSNPWGLTCCGSGEDANLLSGVEGVIDRGFTQPKDLPAVFEHHGAFILPSRFEPWGVVLAEAASSGLPLLCSSACGAGADLVRPYYNGLVVAPDDVEGFVRAMIWLHEHESALPMMGLRSQQMAGAYSAEAWATRWHNYFLEILDSPTPEHG
jgi:glycosyltransferase involved in cell wall biosynthesis